MIDERKLHSQETRSDPNKIKHRIDNTFYSNVITLNVGGMDCHIDFSLFSPDADEMPTTRIFLPRSLLENLREILKNIPQLEGR